MFRYFCFFCVSGSFFGALIFGNMFVAFRIFLGRVDAKKFIFDEVGFILATSTRFAFMCSENCSVSRICFFFLQLGVGASESARVNHI